MDTPGVFIAGVGLFSLVVMNLFLKNANKKCTERELLSDENTEFGIEFPFPVPESIYGASGDKQETVQTDVEDHLNLQAQPGQAQDFEGKPVVIGGRAEENAGQTTDDWEKVEVNKGQSVGNIGQTVGDGENTQSDTAPKSSKSSLKTEPKKRKRMTCESSLWNGSATQDPSWVSREAGDAALHGHSKVHSSDEPEKSQCECKEAFHPGESTRTPSKTSNTKRHCSDRKKTSLRSRTISWEEASVVREPFQHPNEQVTKKKKKC